MTKRRNCEIGLFSGLAVATLLLWSSLAHCQDTSGDTPEEPTLEDLFNLIVVTATKKSQQIGDAPAVITVITSDEIKKRGYQSVGEALESVAGLYPLTDHLLHNVGIRGVNSGVRSWSRNVKVMIDGQPVSFRPSTENFLGEELIPIAMVKRIEVVRGPASALYGANAFLGVINVITKDGADLEYVEISGKILEMEGNASFGTSVAFGRHVDGFDIAGAATYGVFDRSGLNPVNIPGRDLYDSTDQTQDDEKRPASVFAKVGYQSKAIGRLKLDFNYQRLDSQAEFQDWATLPHNNRVSLENMYVRGQWNRQFAKHFDFNLWCAYAHGKPTNSERLNTSETREDWIVRKVGNNSLDAGTDISLNIGESSDVRIGFDYVYDRMDLQTFYQTNASGERVPNQGIEFGEETFSNLGLYVQTMLFPLKLAHRGGPVDFGVVAGLRYDRHNDFGNHFNYRAGIVSTLGPLLQAKVLYGTSFKAPASTQLYTNMIRIGGINANPDLKSEKAQTIEATVTLTPFRLLSLSATGFYSHIKDKVELVLPSGLVSNLRPENIASMDIWGLEAETRFIWKELDSYANYSLQKSSVERTYPIEGKTELPAALYPSHMFKFGVNYGIPKIYLNLNVEGRYISSRIASERNNFIYDPINYRTQRYSLDDYFTMDVMVSTNDLVLIGDRETIVGFKVYNLFDAGFEYPGFRDADIPGLGRVFMWFLTQKL